MSTDSPSSSNVRLGLTIVALAGVLVASAFAWLNERGDDAAVASYLGDELTVGELHEILESLPPNVPAALDHGTMGKAVPGQVITQWIQYAAFRAELADRGYVVGEQDRATALAAMANDPTLDPSSGFGRFLIGLQAEIELANRYVADEVGPVDVEPPEYLCSAHILLESEQDALDVIALLDEDRDFAQLAIEFSTGPSGPNGGDLGCVPSSTFVPEFSDGARVTGVGVSAPVQSQFGWHVIQVRSIGPLAADVHPEMDPVAIDVQLESAANAANEAAFGELRRALESGALARLGAASDVFVDPRYGRWDAASLTVLPIGG
ncbi:MAG: peptidylprolyl isomerase [Acidimicrobiales bacterium]